MLTLHALPARLADIGGGLTVHRALPQRERRMVGPWCFLDHMGPIASVGDHALNVPPHPHIGLQTVTWMVEGEVLHRDGLGNAQLIRPGQLNLMTAGRGIAHSEESQSTTGRLHGVQLWTALPDAQRDVEPTFDHHPSLPVQSFGDLRATVLMGSLGGALSPAKSYSPIVAAELLATRDGKAELPLDPSFEYALLPLTGTASIDGTSLITDTLYDLGQGRDRLVFDVAAGARLMLIGGAPFGEAILMWWNFVARTHDEIASARADWEAHRRFPPVPGYPGDRLTAPPLLGHLMPPV